MDWIRRIWSASASWEHRCRRLRIALGSGESERYWQRYCSALSAARRVGPSAIATTVNEFDRQVGPSRSDSVEIGRTLHALAVTPDSASDSLEAALLLAERLGDARTEAEIRHLRCLQLARQADSNGLIALLFRSLERGELSAKSIDATLRVLLVRRELDVVGWKELLSRVPDIASSQVHQVHAVLGRYEDAARMAETTGEHAVAWRYLRSSGTLASARAALSLAERLDDESRRRESHVWLGEELVRAGETSNAAAHFLEAGERVRASECLLDVGQYAAAVAARPTLTPKFAESVRQRADSEVRRKLDAQDHSAAAALLRELELAWRARLGEDLAAAEASRTSVLLAELVRTVRNTYQQRLAGCSDFEREGTERRWSQFEERAGNLLEAALHAEAAKDYVSAALLFEKADAPGRALSVLRKTGEVEDLAMRARLLEEAGDYRAAGLAYEKQGDIDRAIAMFVSSGDPGRAADSVRSRYGHGVLSPGNRWFDLMIQAGRGDAVAKECEAVAQLPETEDLERQALLECIVRLAAEGRVAPERGEQATAALRQLRQAGQERIDAELGAWFDSALQQVHGEYLSTFGLDLGTTNTVVALYNVAEQQAEPVSWKGRPVIPSTVATDSSGAEFVGLSETELLGRPGIEVALRSKRDLGTDRLVILGKQRLRPEELLARIVSLAREVCVDHLVARVVDHMVDAGRDTTPAAMLRAKAIEYAEARRSQISLPAAVVTVPAYFNDAQKQATRASARIAGIEVLRLMHEPTAACLAQEINSRQSEKVLVVDLGAGTLDLSLLDVNEGVIEVVELQGDSRLGGVDLDAILVEHLLEEVKQKLGKRLDIGSLPYRRVCQAAESLKIGLSSESSSRVGLRDLVDGEDHEFALNQKELEQLARPWLERIEATCRLVEGKADRVLLIGGGGLMPPVRRIVARVFGKEPTSGSDPITAVARGAAVQGAVLAQRAKSVLVLDAVPFRLGIEVHPRDSQRGVATLIAKHTKIPVEKRDTFTTTKDNQATVDVRILQGDDPDPDANFTLGLLRLDGIPPAPAGMPKIEVSFTIDANCVLTVTARDAGTGAARTATIVDSHLLTPAQELIARQRFDRTRQQCEARTAIKAIIHELVSAKDEPILGELLHLGNRLDEALCDFSRNQGLYLPTERDAAALQAIFRDEREVASSAQLARDRWQQVQRAAMGWINVLEPPKPEYDQLESLRKAVESGRELVTRVRAARGELAANVRTYRRWIAVFESLPLREDGEPLALAQRAAARQEYTQCIAQLDRLGPGAPSEALHLRLFAFARLRDRESYARCLAEHRVALGLLAPDFERLNRMVREIIPSIVWIRGPGWSGSGFAISQDLIATNRHVVTDRDTDQVVAPGSLHLLAFDQVLPVERISVSERAEDDVAIIKIRQTGSVRPLRLGFSELVEAGETVAAVGFPDEFTGNFEESLYCNKGVVNRIRRNQLSRESEFEISIDLRAGISGSPLLNEFGEVCGIATRARLLEPTIQGNTSLYKEIPVAVPVRLIRELLDSIRLDLAS